MRAWGAVGSVRRGKRRKTVEVDVAVQRGEIEVNLGMVLRFFFSKLVSGDLGTDGLMLLEAFCVVGYDNSSCVC